MWVVNAKISSPRLSLERGCIHTSIAHPIHVITQQIAEVMIRIGDHFRVAPGNRVNSRTNISATMTRPEHPSRPLDPKALGIESNTADDVEILRRYLAGNDSHAKSHLYMTWLFFPSRHAQSVFCWAISPITKTSVEKEKGVEERINLLGPLHKRRGYKSRLERAGLLAVIDQANETKQNDGDSILNRPCTASGVAAESKTWSKNLV